MRRSLAYSDDASALPSPLLPTSILDAWNSLSPDVRAALVASEMSSVASTEPTKVSSCSSLTSGSSNRSDSSSSDVKNNNEDVLIEEDIDTGVKTILRPLERAPKNVFELVKTTSRETTEVKKTASSTVMTKTTVMTSTKGWRNVFTLPISYDVNMVPNGTLLDPANPQMLEATGVHPEGYNRRFAVIDEEVNKIHGTKIIDYFATYGIELTTVIITGGEPDKRPDVSIRIWCMTDVLKMKNISSHLAHCLCNLYVGCG